LHARMMRAFCAFVRPPSFPVDTVNHVSYELPAIRHEQRDGLSDLLGSDLAEYVSRWNYNLEAQVQKGSPPSPTDRGVAWVNQIVLCLEGFASAGCFPRTKRPQEIALFGWLEGVGVC
jgi:hypothetical protein